MMIERIADLMVKSGATWVLCILIVLSIASLAVTLDRLRVLWGERESPGPLQRELDQHLSNGEIDQARAKLESKRCVAGCVVAAGLAQWGNGAEAVKRAMTMQTGLERTRLERRLLFLGTVGNNAPFVGLLGTVIGIMGAFSELANSSAAANVAGQLAPERVMSTIAEALVATAIGLMVAIPAVALFNYFQARVTRVVSSADALADLVLMHAPNQVAAKVDPAQSV
jgi:biopolymer transport protein ExbB